MTTAGEMLRPVGTLDVPASERATAADLHRGLIAALGLHGGATWSEITAEARRAGQRPNDDQIADWLEAQFERAGLIDPRVGEVVQALRCGLGPIRRIQ